MFVVKLDTDSALQLIKLEKHDSLSQSSFPTTSSAMRGRFTVDYISHSS